MMRPMVPLRPLAPLRALPVAIVVAALVGLGAWVWVAPLQSWELAMTGLAQEWRGARRLRTPVSIVAIDDYSLQQGANADLSGDPLLRQLQSWPWPRAIQAVLIDRLQQAGARAVAIDLLFDAPSSHGAVDDGHLAEALRRHRPRTVLAAQVMESKGDVAGLALSPPIALLREAAGEQAQGLLNGPTEPDGSIRRRPGDQASTLRRELAAVPQGFAVSLMQAGGLADRSRPPALGGRWLPLLDPYGPPRTIPTLSVWSLLEPRSFQALRASGRLRDQLVLIGPTATLFQDLHQGPFAGAEGMPGVELHATELANRAEGRALWLWQPPRALWALGLALLSLLVMLLAECWERPLQRLALVGGSALGLAVLAVLLIGGLGLAPQLFGAAGMLLLCAVVSSADATLRLQWQRFRLRSALERYLSPSVAAEIASQPREADGLLGGRSVDVVVMFADIRGFTARTRRMSETGRAKELVQQLNAYFSEVVAAVHGEGGTVDKFIGDAALAVFGAPLNRGARQEAAAALRAARDLQRRLLALNERWRAEGVEPWEQVIVLNFGAVISGNVGSSTRMDYTVIGDAVNATSRLEGVAKSTNRPLVMSAAFAQLLPENERLEPLGRFELRGFGETEAYGLPTSDKVSKENNPEQASG